MIIIIKNKDDLKMSLPKSFDIIKLDQICRGELMEKQYTTEDLMNIIKNLDNLEREKFLNEMFYEYFNSSNKPRVPIDWE